MINSYLSENLLSLCRIIQLFKEYFFLELLSATVNVLLELNYVNCWKIQSELQKVRFQWVSFNQMNFHGARQIVIK